MSAQKSKLIIYSVFCPFYWKNIALFEKNFYLYLTDKTGLCLF